MPSIEREGVPLPNTAPYAQMGDLLEADSDDEGGMARIPANEAALAREAEVNPQPAQGRRWNDASAQQGSQNDRLANDDRMFQQFIQYDPVAPNDDPAAEPNNNNEERPEDPVNVVPMRAAPRRGPRVPRRQVRNYRLVARTLWCMKCLRTALNNFKTARRGGNTPLEVPMADCVMSSPTAVRCDQCAKRKDVCLGVSDQLH